ncbi:hypothetical protein GGD83_004229 [Rhodoblastus sphagnicola]|nr:hypothetical protein [Rhodoblastus sphagnicola]MBB4200400.1 hypothetical protein [Rhodoblastus sphagnicola]
MNAKITASTHGTPGEVVTIEEGQIAWIGPIEALEEAGNFDAVFCHEDDEERLIGYPRINSRQNQRTDNIGAS